MVGAMPDESNKGEIMNGLGTIQARNDSAVRAAYQRAVERGDIAGANRIADANPDLELASGLIPLHRELHTDSTRDNDTGIFASLVENDRRRSRGAQAMREMIAAIALTRIQTEAKIAKTPIECYAAAVLRGYNRRLREAEEALQNVVEQLELVRGLML